MTYLRSYREMFMTQRTGLGVPVMAKGHWVLRHALLVSLVLCSVPTASDPVFATPPMHGPSGGQQPEPIRFVLIGGSLEIKFVSPLAVLSQQEDPEAKLSSNGLLRLPLASGSFLTFALESYESSRQVNGILRTTSPAGIKTPWGKTLWSELEIQVRHGEPWVFVATEAKSGDAAEIFVATSTLADYVGVGHPLRLGGELILSDEAATEVGAPELAGEVVGRFSVEAHVLLDGSAASEFDGWPRFNGAVPQGTIGPDVMVAELTDTANYGTNLGVATFSVGTTSCIVCPVGGWLSAS